MSAPKKPTPPATASKNAGQTRGKPFEPGNSLGRGRPAGSRNRATLVLQALIEGEGKAIIAALVKAAKDGDVQAAKALLDRLVPPTRSRTVKIKLPRVETAADIAGATAVVIAAVAAGEIGLEDGQALTGLLEIRRKAIETSDIAARIAALEGQRP